MHANEKRWQVLSKVPVFVEIWAKLPAGVTRVTPYGRARVTSKLNIWPVSERSARLHGERKEERRSDGDTGNDRDREWVTERQKEQTQKARDSYWEKKKAVGNSEREMRRYEKIGSTRMEGKGRHGTKWGRIFLGWEKLLGSEGVGGFWIIHTNFLWQGQRMYHISTCNTAVQRILGDHTRRGKQECLQTDLNIFTVSGVHSYISVEKNVLCAKNVSVWR